MKQQNGVRSKVAKGKFVNGTGTLPKGSNMYKLVYSKKLEKKALKLAKACNISSTAKGAAFSLQTGTLKPAAAFKNATKTWAAEIGANSTLASLIFSSANMTATNFTQLIWAKTKMVGCGTAACTSK